MSQIATRISIYADDRASSAFRAVGREAENLESRLSRLGPGLKTALAGMGAGFGLSEALQQASAYETAVVNMARVTDRSFTQVKADVAGLGPDLGTQTQLMQGYYAVMSAGVTESAAALDLLTTASQGSKAAGVTQSQTITALTKLMAGYAGEIQSATEASDLLFMIEKQGQTTFAELVPVIGDAAAISRQAKVSADEMGATLSAITQTAGGTAQAVTQYRAVLTALIKPQQNMRALLADMGYESGEALIQAKGLAGAILALRDAAGKAGVGMGSLFESSEALTALGPLLASNFARVTANMEAMRSKSGATARAFENWKNTLAGLKETTANLLADLTMSGGNIVAPGAAEALRDLNAALSGVRDNIDTVTTAAGVLGAGYVAMTATQKISTSETLRNAAATASLELAQARGKATILDSAKALAEKALAEAADAKAQRDATAAALAKFNADRSAAVATTDAAQAAIIRAAQEKQLAALTGSAAVAEARYTAAVTASSVAMARASVAGRAWAGVKSAASGVIGLMGGPWVAGFTVAAAAVYGIHSAIQANDELLEKYRKGLSDVADAAEQSGKKITELDLAVSRSARESAARELEKAQADFAKIKRMTEDTERGGGALTYIASTQERFFGYDDGTFKASAAIRDYQKGVIDAYEAQKRLIEIRQQFGRTESIEKALSWIESLVGSLKAAEAAGKKLEDTNARLDGMQAAASGAASGVESLSAALALLGKQEVAPAASLEGAIKALRDYTKTTKDAKDEAAALQKQTAQANLALLKQAADEARAAGRQDDAQKFDAEYAKQKARIPQVGAKTNDGAANRADSARRSLQALNAEIEKLKGSGESFDIQLAKKLAEIAKTGKDAGLSLAEVAAKQQAYSDAANADNQRRYNESLRDLDLSLAQLSGDFEKVRALETAKEIEELTRKFAQFGPVTDEAAAKIDALSNARQRQSQIKDASAAASFYKDLYEKAGLFGAAQEYSNELIRLQAENLKQNVNVSQELIDQWIKLQQIESSHNALDGARRGLVKFGSEYGDVAKQVESTTQSMGNTISSTLADAFMSGEFSAKKFFNSLLSMAVQAMSNVIVGQMFSGLGTFFGGGTGPATFIGDFAAGSPGFSITPLVAHTGGFIGQTALPTRAVPLSLFADAPRYHRGGPILAPDEVPIIAQHGERVLTREENLAYEAGIRPGNQYTIDVKPNINIEIINNTSTSATANVTQTRSNNGDVNLKVMIEEIAANSISSRGKGYRAIQGTFNVKPYVGGR